MSFRWVGRTLVLLAKCVGSSRPHYISWDIWAIRFVRDPYIVRGGIHLPVLSGYVNLYPYNPLFYYLKKKNMDAVLNVS